MRKIEFRSWNYYRGMNYNPIVSDGTDGGETSRVDLNSAIFDCEDVLMQYTGLKDKNEKEIYEGDIVRFDDEIGFIEFDCGKFYIHWVKKSWLSDDLSLLCDRIEIIGNIHENKDLLND